MKNLMKKTSVLLTAALILVLGVSLATYSAVTQREGCRVRERSHKRYSCSRAIYAERFRHVRYYAGAGGQQRKPGNRKDTCSPLRSDFNK
jgi:hypothetical protein